MSDNEETVAEASGIERPLPGALLRQAREAQGLTLGEVSGALKFSTRQIEALESDNFDALQGKTFLRGFIRAYARMLKLQPEKLLAMLEVDPAPVGDQIVPPDNMGETDPVPLYRRYSKALLLVLLLALISAAGVWWYGARPVSIETTAVSVLTPAAITATPPQSEVVTSDTTSTSGTAVQVVPIKIPALAVDFSGLSWLEVKDADGKVLLTGEFPGGQHLETTGKPPYQVWIGKASAVKLYHNGQLVDLQPFTHDEVARLTLDR